MEELLRNRKLRKVEIKEKPIVQHEHETVSKEEHQNLMLDANNEEWESAITEFTFPTHYMSISKEDAQALLLSNVFREVEKKTIDESEIITFMPGNDSNLLQFDYKTQLNDLTNRLQEMMDNIGISNTDGVFVKTSCRSPKDAPAVGDKLKQIYFDRLKSVSANQSSSHDIKLEALLWAGVQCLKVFTAKEAIDLLCSSSRIRVDMFVALNPDLDREWKQNLIVRKVGYQICYFNLKLLINYYF